MTKDPFKIIKRAYVTEKTMLVMERENKLEFIVDMRASKRDIKYAIEKLFEVKVDSVNTKIRKDGKHAIVKLAKEYSAEDLGMRIGVF